MTGGSPQIPSAVGGLFCWSIAPVSLRGTKILPQAAESSAILVSTIHCTWARRSSRGSYPASSAETGGIPTGSYCCCCFIRWAIAPIESLSLSVRDRAPESSVHEGGASTHAPIFWILNPRTGSNTLVNTMGAGERSNGNYKLLLLIIHSKQNLLVGLENLRCVYNH